MSDPQETVTINNSTSQKNSRVSNRNVRKPTNQPKINKSTTEQAYRAFILPQYQTLCDYSFMNNNLQLSNTTQQTKDKLNEINMMIRNSQVQKRENVENQKESKQLKNENTINWLKKRYYDSGNKKYFGDQEDVQQSNFIKSIYDNITKHLKTPEGIQINDFNRLIQQYELPLSFQVLSKIYQIVDHDRDSVLNLYEFQELILNDNANKIFLEQFKYRYKQYSSILYKPTSLSALCIFISFRINHDFLAEFLYDSNFQVKDKSQGLLKMLDLIKVQGQTRIKNDFDKRMIRKLNVEQTAQLGFVSPQQSTTNKKQNLLKDDVKGNNDLQMRQNTVSDSDSSSDEEQENQEKENLKNTSHFGRLSEKNFRAINEQSVLGIKVPQKKTEFQKQMDELVEKANKEGEKHAKQSYNDKKLILEQLQTESQKIVLTNLDSTKSASYTKKAPFLPGLNINTANHMLLNQSVSTKNQNTGYEKTLDENAVDNSKQYTYLNKSIQNSNYFRKNQSQGDLSQKGGKAQISKYMTYMMELTLQESMNCKQAQIARKLMQIEDSATIQQYKKQMDQIKQYQLQKMISSPTPSPNKNILTKEILQSLEGTSFAPKHKSFFPTQ